jgi:DNA ligase-associated metallophosphoesterase
MSDTAASIVAGEELLLLAERAVYWPRREMLLIADPHFGKAASFRALGVRAPVGTTATSLERISRLIADHDPKRLVFLGDFLHAREGRTAETFATLAAWRATHATLEVWLVRGNHDRRAGDPPGEVGIECVDGPVIDPPFALTHHPIAVMGQYVLAGHIHPCATLRGAARQRERLPCFWFGADVGVLPAFGELTGCASIDPSRGDSVWAVAGDRVIRVTLGEQHT